MTNPVSGEALTALVAELRKLPRYWMKIPNVGQSQTQVICAVDVQRVLDAAMLAAPIADDPPK